VLRAVVFTQYQRVTNRQTGRQTDRQTDRIVVASTALAMRALRRAVTKNAKKSIAYKSYIDIGHKPHWPHRAPYWPHTLSTAATR